MTHLQRTMPLIGPLFEPLEDAIRNRFIPALLGGRLISDQERRLLALPCRCGGLAIVDPTQFTQLITAQPNLEIDEGRQTGVRKEVQQTITTRVRLDSDQVFHSASLFLSALPW